MRRPLILLVLPALLLVGAVASSVPADSALAAAAPYTVVRAAPATAKAVHEITAVLIAPAGTTRDFTRDDAITTIQDASAYWSHETNGFVQFHAASVTDWIQPTDPSIACTDPDAVVTFARAQSGWTPGPDKDLVAFVPGGFQCGDFSSGDQGADVDAGGTAYVTDITPAALTHELGHNLSLHHASGVRCTAGWDFDASKGLPSSCARDEYGNTTDLMGSSYSYYPASAPSLDRLGVLSRRAVPTCGATRRIPVQTMSAGADALRVISWTDPKRPAVRYYVQYADVVDQSEYDPLWISGFKVARPSGVQILRTDPTVPDSGTILIRPGDTSVSDELVRPGEKVALADGMSVSVAAMDEIAHTASIDVTVPCASRPTQGAEAAPTAEGALGSTTGQGGTAMGLTMTGGGAMTMTGGGSADMTTGGAGGMEMTAGGMEMTAGGMMEMPTR
ncbi:hypothetical protein BFL36_12930 [Clavibacter michiganensis]|uniref:Gametolysin peptidase M11 n=1 Tax=Clavibacter michiganensis TaxID=28447 RepID=A0A251Y3R4_9MICO|nr:hypothetical protein [Clavibacter michiganensis]OUE18940.1 hypothetical protein BFL36_12930 [Clavibacter michiganensis]